MKRFHWWILSIVLLMFADMLAPPTWGLCVVQLILLPLSWRFLHRRYSTSITATMAVAVAIAGVWHVFVTPFKMLADVNRPFLDAAASSFEPVRLWVFLALMAAVYFHVYLRRRLRQRLERQRDLQKGVYNRSKEVRRINHALRDEVARREETQHRLDQSETTFQSIIDRMQLQVARKNIDGVFTYANDRFCDELGLNAVSVIGSTDADLYQPMIAAKYHADDRKIMTTGINVDQVEEHPGSDGQPGYVQVFKAPEYDQHGSCIGVQVIFWDITEKHRNEMALRDSEARKRALFDSAGDAVLLVDDQGIIVEANRSANSLLQAGGGRMTGHPLDNLVVPEITSEDLSSLESLSTGEESLLMGAWGMLPLTRRHQLRLRRQDGIAFESEISIHKIPVGRKEGRAVIIRDVTLQQRAFEAMRDAKAQAEQANLMKTQFMAGISHELRTPLGGIRGLTDLIAQLKLPAAARRYVNLIAKNTELLYDVIEDILDFSAIEAGRVAIDPTPIDLHEIVGDAFGCLAIRIEQRPVRMCLSIDPRSSRLVIADAKRIRQIVVNLASNAIKFTSEGQVSLRLRELKSSKNRSGEQASERTFEILVEDTGIGISRENHLRIFDAFEQADRGTNKKFGGTGLGLAIARGLAQRMEGDITLESEEGKGSRFCCRLTLPLVSADEAKGLWNATEFAPPKTVGQGTALISVGNDCIEQALIETFRYVRWTAQCMHEDRSVTTLSKSPAGPVHWILTDATADAALRIRARKLEDRVLWLVRPGETVSRRAKNEDAVLIEPVHPDELRRWISGESLRQSSRGLSFNNLEQGLRTQSNKSSSNAALETHDLDASKFTEGTRAEDALELLVVDDSPTNRLVIHDQLLISGYRVQTADSGESAISMIQQQVFDCILMDLQMPDMDGTEATREIIQRFEERGESPPPIIALTAHVTDEHRRMCRDAGMAGYITKPVELETLLREIKRVTADQVRDTQHDQENVSNENVQKPNSSDKDAAKRIGADTTDSWQERLSKHCGNDEVTIASVCEAIVIEVPDLVRRIGQAAKKGDAKKLQTAAHTLKSCLRYVAPADDIAVAGKVEEKCRDAIWMDQLKESIQNKLKDPEDATIALVESPIRTIERLQQLGNDWVKRIQCS